VNTKGGERKGGLGRRNMLGRPAIVVIFPLMTRKEFFVSMFCKFPAFFHVISKS
jgi:hypothetical protein